ncbi:MAG: hypothetical protein DWQ39_00745 [Bacteroidetes bacterium]|nr:MAG: hypothetical protein DWQ33_07405 [Bacteroidota bacterium]REK08116.1 MAG: hypothetical protein DWQ39_00745 [Bacteroidota bacterium]REK49555.1 MAG: hypothetical protein DWQ48_07060 [Bacteroidota bacterium]
MNHLKIYKSSAGSGKTFTLVREYLAIVLARPQDYRHVLAITFTNKAAAEMKSRIIESLVEISSGQESSMEKELTKVLDGINLRERASQALKLILHDYSSFSVNTIDSFFQKILRSLSREMHLPLNLEVEVDLSDAILEVTSMLYKSVGDDDELQKWLGEFMLQKIEDNKSWNIDHDIGLVAREIFRDKGLQHEIMARKVIHDFYNELIAIRKKFETEMKKLSDTALAEIKSAGLEDSDFYYGKSGVISYFYKVSSASGPDAYVPGKRALDANSDPDKWAAGKSTRKQDVNALVESSMGSILSEMIRIYNGKYKDYLSAHEALKRIYIFGIANDLQKKFNEYRSEKNVILLADTTGLLNEIISEQDTPFIYEKTGVRYSHILIDEFQDTSLSQWSNLLPLVKNSLGSGNSALVVGDAKQSIYRWRGGDLTLLLEKIFEDLGLFRELFREENLSTNFRSRKDIINFNNSFFKTAPTVLSEIVGESTGHMLELAYNENLQQNSPHNSNLPGYVKIDFLESTEENSDGENSGWKERSLENNLETIRDLTENKGYEFRDICILVRKNDEGNQLARFLMDNGVDKIISPDSLLISSSPKIRFLLNSMRFINDTRNSIAKTDLLYYYVRYILKNEKLSLHEIFSDHLIKKKSGKKSDKPGLFDTTHLVDNLFNEVLPSDFTGNISTLAREPVFDLTEKLISIFTIDKSPDAYVQRFQDLVLEYSTKHDSGLDGFLDWIDSEGSAKNCSVLMPEGENAVRIMSIHKSKGLQFPVVIMPFAEWQLKPKANELLWLSANDCRYSKMGSLPVPASSRLNETVFSESWNSELMQSVVDNLNLLYVAFTRAEEQLLVTCVRRKRENLNGISALISHCLFSQGIELIENAFETGDKHLKKQTSKTKTGKLLSEKISRYEVTGWKNRIRIRTKTSDLLDSRSGSRLEKINYGILIHRILSGIRTMKDIEPSLHRIYYEGLISKDDITALSQEISALLSMEDISGLFQSDDIIFPEREILSENNEILRPDRVCVSKSNKVKVVDFKTGEELKSHHNQVRRYSDAVKLMGYQDVSTFLLYIPERKLVKVS